MRRMGLAGKTLRDVRGATISIAIGNGLLTCFLLAVYPSYRESLKDFELPEYYRGMVGEAGTMATAAGYFSAHAFIAILLLITLAIISGTGALAGEETAGTLDLLLAQPVGRARLVLAEAAVLALAVAAATLTIFAGFLVAVSLVDIDISAGRMFATVISFIPLVWLFLALSLWGGAVLSSRGAATALAVGVVAVAFFLNTIGAMVDLLKTPRKLSPFYWADPAHVLLHGFDWPRPAGCSPWSQPSSSSRSAALRGAKWPLGRGSAGHGSASWQHEKRCHYGDRDQPGARVRQARGCAQRG